jgi:hypothetical protein
MKAKPITYFFYKIKFADKHPSYCILFVILPCNPWHLSLRTIHRAIKLILSCGSRGSSSLRIHGTNFEHRSMTNVEIRTIKTLCSWNVYFVLHLRHTADPSSRAVEGVGYAAVCFLSLRVLIPPEAWMLFSCECCVLLGRGLWDGRSLVQRSLTEDGMPKRDRGTSQRRSRPVEPWVKKKMTTRHWAKPKSWAVRNVRHPSSEFNWPLHRTLVLEPHAHYRQLVTPPRFSQA